METRRAGKPSARRGETYETWGVEIFAVVLCISAAVRKLEQGTYRTTREKARGKAQPVVSGARPTAGQQQALSALRNQKCQAILRETMDPANEIKDQDRRDRRQDPVRSAYIHTLSLLKKLTIRELVRSGRILGCVCSRTPISKLNSYDL